MSKAGKRVRYINFNQTNGSPDKFRTALGRFWTNGTSGMNYGVDFPEKLSPFYASVGPTETVAKTTDCPFVHRSNRLSITPNPNLFAGINAKESFKVFLNGGVLAAAAFSPYNNLTAEEFEQFSRFFEIEVTEPDPQRPGSVRLLTFKGLLGFCKPPKVEQQPQQESLPEADVPHALMMEVGESDDPYFEIDDLIHRQTEDPEYVGDDIVGQPELVEDDPEPEEPQPRPQPQPIPPVREVQFGECCDMTFEIMTPFSPAALEHFDAQNNVTFGGLTFGYNYTNDVYKTFEKNPSVEEKDLPNLYLTLTDGNAGRFIRTATSRDVCDTSVDHILETTTGYRYLLSTAGVTRRMPEVNRYAQFFPYQADLQFTTDREAQFADSLAARKMDGILLRRIHEGPFRNTFCKDPFPRRGLEDRVTRVVSSQVVEADVSTKKVQTRGNVYNQQIAEIDFCKWFEGTEDCVVSTAVPSILDEDTKFFAPTPAKSPGSIDSADISVPAADPSHDSYMISERFTEFNLLKIMAAEYTSRNFGGYRQLLQTGVNSSETLAYKVSKWDPETYRLHKENPTSPYQPMQVIYFSNTSDVDFIHYVDTQIKYNTGYVYEVMAYEMVLGTKYQYIPSVCSDSWARQIPLDTGPVLTALSGGPIEPGLAPFLTLIRLGRQFKNGSITYEELQRELRNWTSTYHSDPTFARLPGFGTPVSCSDKEVLLKIDSTGDRLQITIGCLCNEQKAAGNEQCETDNQLPSLDLRVVSAPCIKIYTVPYFVYQGRLLEHPPVRPLVDLIPYRAVNNQILINLSNGMGVESQIPIYINEGEESVIEERLKTENYLRTKIDFRSHPGGLPPAGFEIYRMTEPPTSYQDFSGHLLAFVSTDADTGSRQAADSASFVDDLVPNQKYYYIFRTIGSDRITEGLSAPGVELTLQTLFSNPTPVYEAELVDDDGAVYLLIRVVDFDILNPPPTTKEMKRLLHVKPSLSQSLLKDYSSEPLYTTVLGVPLPITKHALNYESAHDYVRATPGGPRLGLEAESIWGKTYKVRLTSKHTCRKLDFNVKFTTEHIRQEECGNVSIVGVPYDSEEEVT